MKLSEKLAGYAQHIDSYSMALDIADAGREAAKLEEIIENHECDDCSSQFICDKHWEEFISEDQEPNEFISEDQEPKETYNFTLWETYLNSKKIK